MYYIYYISGCIEKRYPRHRLSAVYRAHLQEYMCKGGRTFQIDIYIYYIKLYFQWNYAYIDGILRRYLLLVTIWRYENKFALSSYCYNFISDNLSTHSFLHHDVYRPKQCHCHMVTHTWSVLRYMIYFNTIDNLISHYHLATYAS